MNALRARALGFVGASLLLIASAAIAQDREHTRSLRTEPEYLEGVEATNVSIYRDSMPTTVVIQTLSRSQDGVTLAGGLGSGVLISPSCHVLTAAHVVEDAEEITVKTYDGRLHRAEKVFSVPRADLALIRLLEPDPDLPHAPLGDSDQLAVGQSVYVLGNPLGLEYSFSIGHISGFRHFNQLFDGTVLAEFIQTDAAINSGNSGGPVFNSRGEVIGIASRILTASGGFEGIGFVVTINTAKQLLALREQVWIGLDAIFLDGVQLALLGYDYPGGSLIQYVSSGSPAALAGLRAGTQLIELGGQPIVVGGDLILELGGQESCHGECLARAHDRVAGSVLIPVRYVRDGKIFDATIDVSETRRNFLQKS
jgi:serine protease Do